MEPNLWKNQTITQSNSRSSIKECQYFLPPIETSALGLEYSSLAGQKLLRAVRQVNSCWGMSRLKAIPLDRFPMTRGFLGRTLVCSKGVPGVDIINPKCLSSSGKSWACSRWTELLVESAPSSNERHATFPTPAGRKRGLGSGTLSSEVPHLATVVALL